MTLRKNIILICLILMYSCTTQLVLDSKENQIINVLANPDSIINSIIYPYKIGIDSVMNEVLCVSEIEMKKGKPESLLGNFVTDLCMKEYNDKADICILNNGGLRTSIPKGNITRRKIYELMPFENELVILELNVKEIFDLIKYVYSREGEPFSGLNIFSKDSCMLLSNRYILYRKGGNIVINEPLWVSSGGVEEEIYIPLNNKETYKIRVLTSDYLANGGDKMSFFNNKEQLKVGKKLRDVIIKYCKSEKIISSKLDNRISIIKKYNVLLKSNE